MNEGFQRVENGIQAFLNSRDRSREGDFSFMSGCQEYVKAYGRAFRASGQGQITGACGGAFFAMITQSLWMPLAD